ncbi:cystathionine beta-lyase/cystathionine gamma-synthase [Rhizobium cellulosilyticum]|uniref:Cystathionine beta-lyase/cystathionine gamma-synthase n=1 Tax=Aliirhizobium cellulosilyticum TaxID=393664 RepID=A0A7W6V1X1_9HYPH|nr:cystathionine beta-lyase/cystathionine gamma-synthase [Rhizobium cellulosilyticum]MBB4413836.1 cystathionine beta-lyase/cystathionine gamma-synthase [Rhizobium cellulosilyticum]MBB4448451.1 cystathionine beta-lyase/cystathionine gamma-synthase [Rhizobium cellulosilyticum]
MELFGLGYSWGGFPSLALHVNLFDRRVTPPPSGGPVLRLQIGLEDVADLIEDLERGLSAAKAG